MIISIPKESRCRCCEWQEFIVDYSKEYRWGLCNDCKEALKKYRNRTKK